MANWRVDRDRVLSHAEVMHVIADLSRKARRSKTTRRNLILFALATCCGLRVSELTRLRLGDIRLGVSPSIRVPGLIAKGGRARTVPLTWDIDTLADIVAWIASRRAEGATDESLLLVTRSGRQIDRFAARKAFINCCRGLGRPVTIHDGRHTFASHSLHCGRRLESVRDVLGHANIATTSLYAHLVEPDEAIGTLFDRSELRPKRARAHSLTG